MLFWSDLLKPRPHVSGESGIRIRNFLNPLSRVEKFEYAMNSESCGRYIRTIRTFFLSSDVTRWSSVLYREYCIQEGDLDACSVANIPGGVLRTPVNPDTCRIRVDGQIRFASGYVRTWKFLNPERKSCGFKNIRISVDGWGLRIVFFALQMNDVRSANIDGPKWNWLLVVPLFAYKGPWWKPELHHRKVPLQWQWHLEK